jgi:rare lipoprotein A
VWLAGCATTSSDTARDSAPRNPPPDLAKVPEPVPRIEPRSKYGNASPYEVFGKKYYVMPNPTGYSESGRASWYGAKFHGRPTSSGEPYDMYRLTAAHRSLPIPCYVRVTNLDNNKSVIVRVNDRGPFHSERLIDLSYAGAVKLGFANQGTARVRVELVDGTDQLPAVVAAREPPAIRPPSPGAVAVAAPQLFLQAGAFSNQAGAERLRGQLRSIVGEAVHVDRKGSDGFYRVRIGPISAMSEATRLQNLIVSAAHPKPLIVTE